MKIIYIALLSFISIASRGQDKSLSKEISELQSIWNEGSIMLKNGTELKGVLNYNDKTGVLSFENGADTWSFTSQSVLGFEFFDQSAQRQRVFYSLRETDEQSKSKRYWFFEALR